MGYVVERLQAHDAVAWDAYVENHNAASYCHLSGWQTVIALAYGRPTHFWVCREAGGGIAGLLPTVHLKHPLFGNSLVSLPYLDGGGILADNSEVCRHLLDSAKESAAPSNIPLVELRQLPAKSYPCEGQTQELPSDKVQMIIPLPDDPDLLFKGFQNKNKIRTIVRKAVKLGLRFVLGGEEKLDEFYHIFAMNQRELGTPVHARRFFQWVLKIFQDYCRVGVVYIDATPIAAGIIFFFKDAVSFPWGGSLKSHYHLNPFPFLVWEFLKISCEGGYQCFDFGRSSLDSGPYNFKARWGARPYPLHWQQLRISPGSTIMESRSKFLLLTKIWQKLPLPVTIWLGPGLRKYISL